MTPEQRHRSEVDAGVEVLPVHGDREAPAPAHRQEAERDPTREAIWVPGVTIGAGALPPLGDGEGHGRSPERREPGQ